MQPTAVLKHLQVLGNQPQNRIFLIVSSNKILAAENLEDLVVLTLSKIGESLRKLVLRDLINVLARYPYIIHEGLRHVEDTHLVGIELAFRYHCVIDRLVQSAGVDRPRFARLGCGGMTACIAIFQSAIWIYTRLTHLQIRHQMTACGIDVAKSKS